MAAFRKYGKNWPLVAKHVQTKVDTQCKSYYYKKHIRPVMDTHVAAFNKMHPATADITFPKASGPQPTGAVGSFSKKCLLCNNARLFRTDMLHNWCARCKRAHTKWESLGGRAEPAAETKAQPETATKPKPEPTAPTAGGGGAADSAAVADAATAPPAAAGTVTDATAAASDAATATATAAATATDGDDTATAMDTGMDMGVDTAVDAAVDTAVDATTDANAAATPAAAADTSMAREAASMPGGSVFGHLTASAPFRLD